MKRHVLALAFASILVATFVSDGAAGAASSARRSTIAGGNSRSIRIVGRPGPAGSGPIVRIFRLKKPWSDRDLRTWEALGFHEGVDLFVEPLWALGREISRDTSVVVISSNSAGSRRAALRESRRAAQRSMESFVRRGGVLVVDLADNLERGGFAAPGATGTPRYIFPAYGRCDDATLVGAALGPDRKLGTFDDHPFVLGPDGLSGTSDDLNDRNIDLDKGCFIAHGNLVNGIALPRHTTWLMTARFRAGPRPILGEYCLGAGRVIVDTVTKEFYGQNPAGNERPSLFMRNLFAYALSPAGHRCHGRSPQR